MRSRVSEIPTMARCFAASLVLVSPGAFAEPRAALAPGLTEADAVQMALNRPSLAEALDGEVRAAEGRARRLGAAPNPRLAYMREQTFGDSGSSEHSLSVAQTFDLAGRRTASKKAEQTRAAALKQSGAAVRAAVAADARERFYELLFRNARVAALQAWGAQISSALAIVTQRQAQGDAALYDRRRLEREHAVALARLESERAAEAHAAARLAALLGKPQGLPDAQGELLPRSGPPVLSELSTRGRSRPDLLAMELEAKAMAASAEAASRWWVPELRVEAGYKGASIASGDSAHGYILGASLSLPLWNKDAGARTAAMATARALRGKKELRDSELQGQLRGAYLEAERLGTAAKKFQEQVSGGSHQLVQIANAGYQGGELGLLELLDAYRGAAEDSLMLLEMQHAARHAAIELERLAGAAK